jgi:hypothetical protein
MLIWHWLRRVWICDRVEARRRRPVRHLEQRLLPLQAYRAVLIAPAAADELRHVVVGPVLHEAKCGADHVVQFRLDGDPFPPKRFRGLARGVRPRKDIDDCVGRPQGQRPVPYQPGPTAQEPGRCAHQRAESPIHLASGNSRRSIQLPCGKYRVECGKRCVWAAWFVIRRIVGP